MPSRVVLFNKPYGVVSQFTPLGSHPTLAGFHLPPDVYPAGRLDADSEGLLLLSDDGALHHRLTDPRYAHPRTYWVQVEGEPTHAQLEKLRSGLRLKDGPTRPCRAHLLCASPVLPPREVPIRFRRDMPACWLEVTLTEGRNRQLRRMTAAIGHPALRLVRVRIGTLDIGSVARGTWRELTLRERRRLYGVLGIKEGASAGRSRKPQGRRRPSPRRRSRR